MRNLLADDTIAFRAVPETAASDPTPRYWRVFILDRESSGTWRRGAPRRSRQCQLTLQSRQPNTECSLLLDDHDPATLPAPDWPAGFSTDYGYNLQGELIATPLANPRQYSGWRYQHSAGRDQQPPEVAPLSAV